MEELDKWVKGLSIDEDIPGKSYYLYDGKKYMIYGKGDTGKCNTLVEVFYRVNDIIDKNEEHNYCSDPNNKFLSKKIKLIVDEYLLEGFGGKLDKVKTEEEKTKIVKISKAYKSFYSSLMT